MKITSIFVQSVPRRLALALAVASAASASIAATAQDARAPQYVPVPEVTRDYIRRAAEGDHLALEGGHMALDGHVMPYMYFQPHEILFLERLGRLRHKTVWELDAIARVDEWRDAFITQGLPADAVKASPGELVGGRHSQIGYEFTLPELAPSATGWERFFTLKPMDMSVPGWPETTIYINGEPKAALQRKHFYWSLDKLVTTSGPQRITMKSFGVFESPRGYRQVAVVERDPLADDLYWKMRVLVEAGSILSDQSEAGSRIRPLIDKVVAQVNLETPHTPVYRQQLKAAIALLDKGFAELASLPKNEERLRVLLHGHLDSAWRWTLDHTDDKLLRLALNNLYLMDRFPEYRYVFTTPFHYERIQALYPEVFERIKAKIKAGQWIANGATYVETDLNLPGGESVVRQFLYGLDYYKNTLGVEKNTLFLPDTFGYPPFFPQVVNSFGLDSLIAMRTNTPEIDSSIYRWRGLDGSELLVNSLTTPAWEYPYEEAIHKRPVEDGERITTYNAPDAGPRRLAGTWEQFKNKEDTKQQLLLVGWGDGGAGGTEDHVELIRRVTGLPGFPQVEWTTLYGYVQEQNQARDKFPVYDGRILPRDWIQRTFMMANGIKAANRDVEQRLQEAEALAVYAGKSGYPYPADALEKSWKTLLLNHFHDIVTGMAVPEVLARAARDLTGLEQSVRGMRDSALKHIVAEAGLKEAGLVIYNPAPSVAGGLVNLGKVDTGNKVLVDAGGVQISTAPDAEGNLWADLPKLGPQQFMHLALHNKVLQKAAKKPADSGLVAKKYSLENALVKITFNKSGQISSYYDKAQARELVPAGRVWNQFIRVDHATVTDDPFSAKAKVSDVFSDNLRAGLTLNWKVGESRIEQRVWLGHNSRKLQFDTQLDWREQHRLEVDFPLNLNARVANYGIPFGYVPMARSNFGPHDHIQTPIAVHEWADVSEAGYGVALINRTRYAYNLKSGGLRMNIAWGQRKHDYQEMKDLNWSLDGSGDAGGMNFSFAILPHEGDLAASDVITEAKAFNHPLVVHPNQAATEPGVGLPAPLITDLPGNILFPTIKRAESGQGTVLRLYETQNRRTSWQGPAGASVITMNEVPQNDSANLFTPFEIKTLIVND
ncbi:alpha-mannosidase [Simiduia sp. 21SJ11W-1]|uniref:alpha-mannosidase n=1 Tax=Simiduia sp. 21SJ11W-1 TaxID=2909669 RepID=UPI00209C9EFA|nr:glycoside hydrolase family 38 C-terminal domain-containing protein [Simiduia sp. 21SJ11W-1]UTA48321.1 alpha-mannosidase [Simiduia sp. 21SJ11W-1]